MNKGVERQVGSFDSCIMETLLHGVNSSAEIPEDAYRVCDMTGSYLYIKKQDYNTFCNLWIPHRNKLCLSLQLYSTPHHSLYFDIDFKGNKESFKNADVIGLLDTFETNLKLHFFPHVYDFTIIYALRPESYGIHVHLPEFTIAHDDYLEFIKRLQSSSILPDDGPLVLDAPKNWSFPGIGKPGQENLYYQPIRIKYFTEDETAKFDVYNFVPKNVEFIAKKFKRIKRNSDSLFRKLLTIQPEQCWKYLYQLMMPIVVGFKPRYKISYVTNIADSPNRDSDAYNLVAVMSFHCEGRMGYVLKSNNLSFESSNFLRLYQYFQYRSVSVRSVETENTAIRKWYEMFTIPINDIADDQSIFKKINLELRLDNPAFLNDRNPLETVMSYDDGYYFLPVFFALGKCLQLSASDLVFHLRPMFTTPEIRSLLDRLENLDKEYVESVSEKLTINTIFFCAHNMRSPTEQEPKSFQDKLASIVKKSKHSILGVSSTAQMSDLLLRIQERYFPIKMITLSNMTNIKTTTFIWNALKHSWKEVNSEKERFDHVANLWTTVKNFLADFRNSGEIGGPDSDVIDKLNLSSVVSTQSSNKSMEQEKAVMDAHKWFLRLGNGCVMDLRTGHVGGVVPEFHMSSRTVNINVPRCKFVEYVGESSTTKKLYDLLVDQKFFTRFLKRLLLDKTDDIYDTGSELVSRALLSIDWENDRYATSMLRFYIHMCKFVAFEYDLLMYFLDVLASSMIAENYARKFFVCKGATNNGKSMLFEIVGRMLGQYYSSILSDNLKKSKNSGNSAPSPDLANTIFDCRMVAMEELEANFSENRIKQITGMSRVAFRALFSSSQSKVPTAKVFVTTNNLPDCLVTDAFRQRTVAFPFNSTFAEKAPAKTSERVMRCLYPKEEYVIEKSYEGCFFLLYLHLRNHIDQKDGEIHYREMPISVVEFTTEYLENTDVYIQFKTHMDVQLVPGSVTTMTDLYTAIRDFMKDKKATKEVEKDIKVRFEQEFHEYRCEDESQSASNFTGIFSNSTESSFTSESLMEEEQSNETDDGLGKRTADSENDLEPPNKKKRNNANSLTEKATIYENVLIKNLKKKSSYD